MLISEALAALRGAGDSETLAQEGGEPEAEESGDRAVILAQPTLGLGDSSVILALPTGACASLRGVAFLWRTAPRPANCLPLFKAATRDLPSIKRIVSCGRAGSTRVVTEVSAAVASGLLAADALDGAAEVAAADATARMAVMPRTPLSPLMAAMRAATEVPGLTEARKEGAGPRGDRLGEVR